nr:MAG TPA: hypothetical protein [Caudoviricetes sp.]
MSDIESLFIRLLGYPGAYPFVGIFKDHSRRWGFPTALDFWINRPL